MAAETEQGFHPLDEVSLVAYINATPALASRLGGGSLDSIEIKEVGDGNLNFVYIVQSEAGSIVVKQVRVPAPHSQHTRSSSLLILTLTAPRAGGHGTRRRSRTCAAWGTRGR